MLGSIVGRRHRASRRQRTRADSASAVRPETGLRPACRVLATDDGLDEPEISVVALVEDRDPLRLGVDEHEELMTELGHPAGGVLLEHRLDGEALRLDDPGLAAGLGRAVGEPAEQLLLLHVPGANPRLLAMVDCAALELVDHLVDAGCVTDGGGVGPQRPAVDDQRHLDDVRILGAPMLLDGQLDEGIGPVVEDSLEPPELAFRVAADALWDLDVLALDDRPHTHLPRHRAPSSVAGSPGGWAGRPAFGRVYTAGADRSGSRFPDAQSLWSGPLRLAFAGHGDRGNAHCSGLDERHGAGREARTGRDDVVDQDDPATGQRSARRGKVQAGPAGTIGLQPERAGHVHGPCHPIEVDLGDGRPGSFEYRCTREVQARRGDPRNELGLVVAAPPPAVGVDRDRNEHLAARADAAPAPGDRGPQRAGETLLTAVLQLVECIADDARERGAPFELEERRGHVGRQPDRDAGGQIEAGVERGGAGGAEWRSFRAAAGTASWKSRVQESVRQPADGSHPTILRRRPYLRLTPDGPSPGLRRWDRHDSHS